ncbi:carboxylesterase BioH (pimeloyl-CoA synthesis) [Pseudidiomarina planktonica]|uniref:Pimeloyl-[acyl-carrier protein] methyl ester esterase n=1 Tax=Pseudidiomarina planktonica TaxID=1323738 RepID=A0A1Y6EAP8_9GAMM|nr:pimeloyl-ACP methyl ester esterase BioH [Pseudidiomarina planktonica]RUO66213.1 pimeloyl-[acyl-carrier protein] methyl ester esterase [Pseudidiomarina planktonica]SMQ59648.1 carboxylesterase BioH (pimeloyl-CoA synthesis) [Pseudidiomarina planktonica]
MVTKIWQQSSGAGADLVVLHGWGLNARVWQPLLPFLTPHFRVHCIDLPGFGDSPWPAETEVSLANYVKLLLPELPDSFHLLGWSMGGLIATELALQAPDRVKTLTTMATSPRFLEDDNWPGMKASVLGLFQRQLKDDFEQTVARFLAIQAMGSPNVRADTKLIKELVFEKPLPELVALRGGLKILADTDLRSRLPHLQCPLWRVYGERDTLVPVSAAKAIQQLVPDSPQWVVEQASHAPFIAHGQELSERLLTFINQH